MNLHSLFSRIAVYLTATILLVAATGCEAEHTTHEPQGNVMFLAERHDLGIIDSEEWFEIPIGASTAADEPRNIGIEIIGARTSAIYGTHYTIESTTVTIPAGERSAVVRIQCNPEALDITDNLGITLRLTADNTDEDICTETEIYLHKCCKLDVEAFTGYAVLTSTWLMQFSNSDSRLVHTHADSVAPNTIVVEDMFYEGYDIRIRLSDENRLVPHIAMPDIEVAGSTGEAFGTIYGNGKLMMKQCTDFESYYSACERFLLLYATMYVDEVGEVGTFANVLEWISDDEAERIMREGF